MIDRKDGGPACDYCRHLGNVPAMHEFKTSTGKPTFCCEQHANYAMVTGMDYVRRVDALLSEREGGGV